MDNMNFYQITDLHLYATKQIGSHGKYFEEKCRWDQKCMAESEAIVDAVFDKLIADKDNEVIIISGDLTFDGEKQSHDLLVTKLRKLKAAGKKVYVTFATHDFYMQAKGYDDNGTFPVPKYTREELRELYADFGWNEELSEHVPSYSYSVRPFDGVRFLMLNDDGDGSQFCGYYDDCLDWIKRQADEAKQNGERVIAVTHHPAVAPSLLYPLFSPIDMLGGHETTVPFMADCGIEFIFTGHTHMQSIKRIVTDKGNKLYHVNTGCITAYPSPIRKVTFEKNGLDVKTEHIDTFDGLADKDLETYMKDHFLCLIRDAFDFMENDIEKFKMIGKLVNLSEEKIEKLKPMFLLLGKIVNKLTFKTLGRLLLVSGKVDPVCADLKVKAFMLEIVCQMFSGERKYQEDTVEYKAFMAIVKRLGMFVKLKDTSGKPLKLDEIFRDLLCQTGEYDYTNAFLPF